MNSARGHPPEAGVRVFEAFFRVRFHEVDALGHVNNAAYLNYLEQAAIDHAARLGLDLGRLRQLGGVFVARRHEIDFLKPAFAGDVLRVVTWLANARGARVDRHYLAYREMADETGAPFIGRLSMAEDVVIGDDLVVRAVTEWVFANDGGQPRRIPEDIVAVFGSGGPVSRHSTGAD